MTSPTVQVFVSSTWLDLQPERRAVEVAVQRMRETKFVGMEYFGSRDETTQSASLVEVDRSHVYVGIIGGRYGSGITEDEYRRAQERSLACFIYFKLEANISPENLEQGEENAKRLKAFKAELRIHTVTDFVNPDDLAARVTADLHRWLFDKYLPTQLEGALQGTVPQDKAQNLLSAVKDSRLLNQGLLVRLRRAGIIVAGDMVQGDKDVVHGDKIVYQSASLPTFNALHQLPSPPRDFTGREAELNELMRALEQGGVTISGLQGLGGVGKTTLALKLAQQLTPRYPDAQFYLDLKGTSKTPLSAADAMSHVIRAYHPTDRLPEGEAELSALYRSVLHNQRAILLMDNAADAWQVEPLIPPESCIMLVTSRQHFALPGLFTKNLDTLPAEDAHKLLLRIASRIGEQANTIARLCGYLPLALRLAASALAERIDLGVEDYVRRLTDAKQRLKLIDASLSLSYDLLSPEMQERWRSLAVFPDTFDPVAAAAVWEIELDAAQDALSELVKYSLLDWDEATARYRLHDLARLFANASLSEAERTNGQRRHASHYLSVSQEAKELYKQGGDALRQGLVLFDLEWSNIQFGQSWAEEHSSEDDVIALLCSNYPNAGLYLLDLRQHPREQIRWLESALAAAQRLKDRAAEGAHLGNLGNAYFNLGDMRRAIEFYEQDQIIAREIGDQHGEGNALCNLGNAYKNLGETRRAIDFYGQGLVIARYIGNLRSEGQALGSLGNAYAELGEWERGVDLYKQALVIHHEIGDRRSEGMDLGNLGAVYASLGETRRAIEFYEQDLIIAREIGDRRGECAVLVNLGNAYAILGEARRAIKFYEQQLVIAREIGNRRVEGLALRNMSVVLNVLGKRNEAIAHAESALEIYEQIEHPSAAKVREQLAEWRRQGK